MSHIDTAARPQSTPHAPRPHTPDASHRARPMVVPPRDAQGNPPAQESRRDSLVETQRTPPFGRQDRLFRADSPMASPPSSRGHARSASTHSSPGRPGTQGRPNRMSGEEQRSVHARLQQVDAGQQPFVPRRLSEAFEGHGSRCQADSALGSDPTLQPSPNITERPMRSSVTKTLAYGGGTQNK